MATFFSRATLEPFFDHILAQNKTSKTTLVCLLKVSVSKRNDYCPQLLIGGSRTSRVERFHLDTLRVSEVTNRSTCPAEIQGFPGPMGPIPALLRPTLGRSGVRREWGNNLESRIANAPLSFPGEFARPPVGGVIGSTTNGVNRPRSTV